MKIWSEILEQAREGGLNEDHFANNQKCARNVKTKNMPLLPIGLVESFAIATRHPRCAHRRLRVPWHLHLTLAKLHTQLPFVIF